MAAATSASSRTGSTSDGTPHRHAHVQARLSGSRQRTAGRRRPGGAAVLDHLDITVREHPDMVRETGQRAPPSMQVRGLGHERPSSLDGPRLVQQRRHPATQPVQEVGWGQRRIEIRADVVDGRPDGCQHLIEGLCEALGEGVLLVQRGQRPDERPGRAESGESPPGSCRRLHQHLVLVREDERVGLDVESIGRLASLAGHRVGAEQSAHPRPAPCPAIAGARRRPRPTARVGRTASRCHPGRPSVGWNQEYSAWSASSWSRTGSIRGRARSRATTVTPRYTGGSTTTRVPTSRVSSSRRVTFSRVGWAGNSCSNRTRPRSLDTAGTMSTRTALPASSALTETHRTRGHLRRRLPGDLLEVLGGHGAVAGPQQDGPSDLGRLHVLAVDAAVSRLAVLDPRHVGDGRLEHRQGAPRDVALVTTAGAICRAPGSRSPSGAPHHMTASEPSPRRTAGPNMISPAIASRVKCRSVGPLVAKFGTCVHSCQSVLARDLDGQRRLGRHHRSVMQQMPVTGHPLGDADRLVR